jgi:hypothetical protein
MWDNYDLNAELLDLKLWGEGCTQYQIQQTGDDEFCLIQSGSLWRVVYAERGNVQDVLFESSDEAKACEFMYHLITGIRHNHLVGFFNTQSESDAMGQVLRQLNIEHHTDRIPYKNNELRFRVQVYGKDIFAVERHFGNQLPLERWLTMSERIHLTLNRLLQLDPYDEFTKISLNPPIGSEEKLRSLEQQHDIQLPEAYRTFLLEVGNGGKWERLEYYWTIEEVMANNSAEFWNQLPPEFIVLLKKSGNRDLIEVFGNEFDHFSGLLRIADWSCRGRSHFLTAAGDEVDMQENTKTTILVTLYPYNPQQWLQMFLDDIQYGLERIENFLTFIRSGRCIGEIKEYPSYYCTSIAKLLSGTLQIDIDPNLDNAQLISMRSEIDYKFEKWRIKNMGKMPNNFGFGNEQAELRSQRILSKLGYHERDS